MIEMRKTERERERERERQNMRIGQIAPFVLGLGEHPA
jgi:hypothetical protein